MKVYLLRHGETKYNVLKKYQGSRDIPLSDKGRGELVRADISPHTVYVTPLRRTVQTAEILFPDARLIPVPDLREMDFGVFEGRSYLDMAGDPDYRAWVDSGCEDKIPGRGSGGRSSAAGSARPFPRWWTGRCPRGKTTLVILAHGGTQMAVMERYALPHKNYFEWCAPNAGGFVLDASRWQPDRTLALLETVRYTKGETP